MAVPPELLLVVPTATHPAGNFPLAKVKEVLVKPGEGFKENQLLIVSESESVEVFLEQAKASLALVKA